METTDPDADSFVPFDYVYKSYELWLKTKKLSSKTYFMSENRFSYIVNNIGSTTPAHLPPSTPTPLADHDFKMVYKTKSRIRVITGLRLKSQPILLLGEDLFPLPTEQDIGPYILNQTARLAHVLALHRRRALEERKEASKPVQSDTSISSMYKNAYIEHLDHLLRTGQVTPDESRIILSRINAGEHLTDILRDMEEQQAKQTPSTVEQESDTTDESDEYREDDAEDTTDKPLIDDTAT